MATTQPKKGAGRKAKQKRIYLALGLVALAVIGYLWYRGRSSSTSLAASPSGASASPFGTSDSGGGASGSGTGSADPLSGLLSSLQGENQSLLDAFVKGEQGLLSLVGSQVGSPTANMATTEPAVSPVPSVGPAPAVAPAAVAAASSQSQPLTPALQASFGSYPTIDFTPPSPTPPSLGPAQITSQSGPDVGGYQGAPIIDFSPPAQDTSGAEQIGQDILSGAAGPEPPPVAAYTPPPSSPSAPYTTPITSNPTGGSATKKQGVISVH